MKLYNGDCLEVMQELPDGSIDMVLTDPPYGTTACAWDSVIDFPKLWAQLERVVKPAGAIVLFGSEPFSSALRMSNIKKYKYDWIWDKKSAGNFLLAKYQPLKTFENILVFGDNINYYPQLQSGFENRVNTEREFVGVELDAHYYEIAQKRIEDAARNFTPDLFDVEQVMSDNVAALFG